MADFIRNLDNISKALKRIPKVVGIEAINFSKERFRAQNWMDNSTESWPKRKRSRGSARRDQGALLVSSGRLKRSIRVVSTSANKVVIGTDVPYAQAHNEGFRGTVSVKAHFRGKYQKQTTRTRTTTGRARTTIETARTGLIEVKPHKRKMNLPKRQFMGNSGILARKIERRVQLEFNQALKSD